MNGPCVLFQMVMLSSAFHSAVELCGSMYPWCTGFVVKDRSTMTSASEKPCSRSPCLNWVWAATFVGPESPAAVASLVRSASCSTGASGAMASSTSSTCGSTS